MRYPSEFAPGQDICVGESLQFWLCVSKPKFANRLGRHIAYLWLLVPKCGDEGSGTSTEQRRVSSLAGGESQSLGGARSRHPGL